MTAGSHNDGDDHTSDAARTRAALLAHIRHELSSPINAIIGYSEMLIEDADAPEHAEFVADLQ
ncbi:MAG TPA: histidine kinase dimerization/phospho-acceptor domain-containing protein, partial [Pyrinomonadaceae bacterium]|nr:histidine kinase dimerization/phospho-acceptor domain-containing protein [Pyrinomonadaceae bacterium]